MFQETKDVTKSIQSTNEPALLIGTTESLLVASHVLIGKVNAAIPDYWERCILLLLAFYYAYGLNYPKGQQNALRVMQSLIMNDQTGDQTPAMEQYISEFRQM